MQQLLQETEFSFPRLVMSLHHVTHILMKVNHVIKLSITLLLDSRCTKNEEILFPEPRKWLDKQKHKNTAKADNNDN